MATEVGFVKSIKDFLIYIDGLPTIKVNELVENEQGARGWVNALLPNQVEVLLLDDTDVSPGQIFRRAGRQLTVPIGQFLLGRSVNALGVPIDGKGTLAKSKTDQEKEIDTPAPGIEHREFITQQFMTGLTMIDSLIPLGKGQREMVLGDARSGKTSFLISTILNQKYSNTICVYASIGKPVAEVRNLIDTLGAQGALPYTVIVAAASSDPAPLIFITPHTALTIAEYFQKQGRDVLIILDDLGNHAKIHREISLLSDRSPGRESYPGDIFYQHAHLLERAGNFKKSAGGGSITALPVMEINLNDFTTLIPTNLMGMTDGHLLFKSSLSLQGQFPSVDTSVSVTRVGNQTQDRLQNKLATRTKTLLAEATQIETVARFSSELPFATQLMLRQKEQITELLQQPVGTFIPKEIQIILLALPLTHIFPEMNKAFMQRYKAKIIEAFLKIPALSQIIKSLKDFKNDDELLKALEAVGGVLQKMTSEDLTPTAEQSSPADKPSSPSVAAASIPATGGK